MSMQVLADKLGVSRETLYDWEKRIPNFWDRVNARHKELAGQRRVSLMRDKFYIHAMSWKNPALSIKWLEQNDGGWRDPKQKVEHEIGDNMADIIKQFAANNQPEQRKVIDANPTD